LQSLALGAVGAALLLLAAPAHGQSQTPIDLMQGDWLKPDDPGAYEFRVEGDKVKITRHAAKRPEMNIIDVVAEGLYVTEVRQEGETLVVRGGGTCRKSPDGVQVQVYTDGCQFYFEHGPDLVDPSQKYQRLSGFGIMSGGRKAK
jgi:hypothetical protein